LRAFLLGLPVKSCLRDLLPKKKGFHSSFGKVRQNSSAKQTPSAQMSIQDEVVDYDEEPVVQSVVARKKEPEK